MLEESEAACPELSTDEMRSRASEQYTWCRAPSSGAERMVICLLTEPDANVQAFLLANDWTGRKCRRYSDLPSYFGSSIFA